MSYSLRSGTGLGYGLMLMGLVCGCSSTPSSSSSDVASQFVASKVQASAAPVVTPAPVAVAPVAAPAPVVTPAALATPAPAAKAQTVAVTGPAVLPSLANPTPNKQPVKLSITGSASAAQQAPRPFNVMTVNMEHHDKPFELQTVAALLKADPARAPDFIFCQEVLFNRGKAEDSTAAVLAKEMGYYVRGTKRTSDREGIAIVSKYPIEYYDSINLKSQTSRLLLGFRRVSTMAETVVPGVGRVRLVNVHFTNWGFEAHVRHDQLKETLEWAAARERKVPAALTFLAGDFNAEPDFAEMALIKDRSVTGPLAFHDSNGTAFSQGSHGSPDKRIDFIFVSGANIPTFAGEELMWKDGVPTPDGDRFFLSDHLAVVHHYLVAPEAPAPATVKKAQPAKRPQITAVPVSPVTE